MISKALNTNIEPYINVMHIQYTLKITKALLEKIDTISEAVTQSRVIMQFLHAGCECVCVCVCVCVFPIAMFTKPNNTGFILKCCKEKKKLEPIHRNQLSLHINGNVRNCSPKAVF